MKNIKRIVRDLVGIYHESGEHAIEYLSKARRLIKLFGVGPAIVYCWFYSVPQKWTQVEPKIFELMKRTNSFDLDVVLSISEEKLATMLRPMIFYNQISLQLRNFCRSIKNEYLSWNCFAEALCEKSIFTIFKTLRCYKNNRVTFKNLAAMKTLVGMENNLLILDTHVAKVIGISKNEAHKYRTQERLFKDLLNVANEVTDKLRNKGFSDVSMIKWSLAVWFDGAKITAGELLTKLK